MSIKLAKESYVTGAQEIEIPNGKDKIKLYAHEIGYLKVQQIYVAATNEKKDALTSFLVESIKDVDGNQFTYDEALKLKKEVSEPLLAAVISVNKLDGAEKN